MSFASDDESDSGDGHCYVMNNNDDYTEFAAEDPELQALIAAKLSDKGARHSWVMFKTSLVIVTYNAEECALRSHCIGNSATGVQCVNCRSWFHSRCLEKAYLDPKSGAVRQQYREYACPVCRDGLKRINKHKQREHRDDSTNRRDLRS
jgi:hypothetical protein